MPAPILAAGLMGAGSLVGGMLANRARSREAATNRGFQERMRNTEWQAAVADMMKAGINPAIAYSQGGASSPSGNMARKEDAVTPAVSSALGARRMNAEISAIEAGVDKTRAETDVVKGRPTGVLGPVVSRGREAVEAALEPGAARRSMNIVRYEAMNSARNVGRVLQQTIDRVKDAIKRNWSAPTIGPRVDRRR